MFTPLSGLIRKDLQLFLTDRRALILTLVAPIIIASLFGFIFSGVNAQKEPAKIAVALIDLDHSAISQRIVSSAQEDRSL
jgi:ABC-2 type transport system permease protein